jgi:alkanesulfonate monooxygenase SsuD/methylene tetrahydromethanopterin reductase-like flavin-dependent oxidoreductase (luciferase family)
MRFGLFLPPFQDFADPLRVAALEQSAEAAGWDGVFLWDHVLAGPGVAVADSWTTMAAIAASTNRIRFGAMVTPLARRRPWVLARQIVTLDRLPAGRLTVGVGLGDDGWSEFSSFGDPTDPGIRGEVLDEALMVLRALLDGRAVRHEGRHLSVQTGPFVPPPVQRPIPIWAGCRWPNRRPLARASMVSGWFPIFAADGPPGPPDLGDIAEIRTALAEHGSGPETDVIVRFAVSLVPPETLGATVSALEAAGVTWILEGFGIGEPPDDPVGSFSGLIKARRPLNVTVVGLS